MRVVNLTVDMTPILRLPRHILCTALLQAFCFLSASEIMIQGRGHEDSSGSEMSSHRYEGGFGAGGSHINQEDGGFTLFRPQQ